MLSGKPVITAADSGGPTELIEDGVHGLIAPPDPVEIARRIERLLRHPRAAKRMGRAGRERAHGVDWNHVAAVILGERN
jgi:glycosyltransferase involved in cell wall biosynthesis